MDGWKVGKVDGEILGTTEVFLEGAMVFVNEGEVVDGDAVGVIVDGAEVFLTVGIVEGRRVGVEEDGLLDGSVVVEMDGSCVGSGVGTGVVGLSEGGLEGSLVGVVVMTVEGSRVDR